MTDTPGNLPESRLGTSVVAPRTGRALVRLVSGGAVGQALLAAGVPLLSRLVSPAEYGVFASVLAVCAVAGLVATLRLELAVPVVADSAESYRLQRTALASASTVSMVALIVIFLWRELSSAVSGTESLPWVLAPLGLLGTAALQVLQQRLTREREYALSGFVAGIQPGLQLVCQLTLLLVGMSGALSLVGGYALSTLGTAAIGFSRVRSVSAGEELTFNCRTALAVVRKYKEYPAVYTPSALLNVLVLQAPTLVLASAFGVLEAGLYGMATRILSAPVSLVVGAYSRVFFAEASAAVRDNRSSLRTIVRATVVQLGAISLLLVVGLLVAKPLLVPLLGDQWARVPSIVVALLPLYAGQILVAPVTQVTNIAGQHRTQLMIDVARFLVASAVLSTAFYGALNLEVWTWLYSASTAGMYVLLLILLIRISARPNEGRLQWG